MFGATFVFPMLMGLNPQLAILLSGARTLFFLLTHFLGGRLVFKALPPVVTGAALMLIGVNLTPVVATLYWPQDKWVALMVMVALIVGSIALLAENTGHVKAVAEMTGTGLDPMMGRAFAADGIATATASAVDRSTSCRLQPG